MPEYLFTFTAEGHLTVDAGTRRRAHERGHEWLVHLLEEHPWTVAGPEPELTLDTTTVEPAIDDLTGGGAW